MSSTILTNFPMPPQANNMYRNLPAAKGKRFGGRAKSREYVAFLLRAKRWAEYNRRQVEAAITLVRSIGTTQVIDIEADFKFERSRIITKTGKPKRLDTANRLKALHDAIADIIGIDDCFFWSGTFNKTQVGYESLEVVDVKLTVREM